MTTYLEHANLTVPDIDAAIGFLKTVEPKMDVRQDTAPPNRYRWAHIGIGDAYIALQAPHPSSKPEVQRQAYRNYGVNHLGWVVENLDAVVARLEAAGYRQSIPGEESSYRRRAYYYDDAGFEWELVEYLTEDREKRFLYEQGE